MTTITYRANKQGIDELLYDRNGPVVLHQANAGRQAEGASRRRVGVKTGKLKGTIGSRLVRSSGKGWNVEVYAGGPAAPYGAYHHDGTRAHIIRPTKASVLRFKVGGTTVFAQEVHHPGTKPNRFLVDGMRDAGLNPKSTGRF